MQPVAGEQSPLMCAQDGCDQKFADRASLRKHARQANHVIVSVGGYGGASHECPHADCDHVAHSQSTLERHMLVHKDL